MTSIPSDATTKQCLKCKKIYPRTLEFFSKDKYNTDKLTCRCKGCRCKGGWDAVRENLPDGFKRCAVCKQLKPATLEYFSSNPTGIKGLRSACKPCRKEQDARNNYLADKADKDIKYCPVCQQDKPIGLFSRHKSRYDGRHGRCKDCVNRIYNEKHPKPVQEPQTHKLCTGCNRTLPATTEYFSKQLNTLRSRCKTCVSSARKQDRQSDLEYEQWYAERYPEKRQTKGRNRRARNNDTLGSHTSEQIQEQLKRQKYRCYYAACGFSKFKKRKGKYLYHVEHTFPLSRVAGTDIPANDIDYLVLACPSCNLKKHNRYPHEWPEGGRLL